jgi:hypothetical protein
MEDDARRENQANDVTQLSHGEITTLAASDNAAYRLQKDRVRPTALGPASAQAAL